MSRLREASTSSRRPDNKPFGLGCCSQLWPKCLQRAYGTGKSSPDPWEAGIRLPELHPEFPPGNQRSRPGGETAPVEKKHHILHLWLSTCRPNDFCWHHDRMCYELLEEIRVDFQPKIRSFFLDGMLTASAAMHLKVDRSGKVRTSDHWHDLRIGGASTAPFHTDRQAANTDVPLPKIAPILATLLHIHCFKELAGRLPSDERRACFNGSIKQKVQHAAVAPVRQSCVQT